MTYWHWEQAVPALVCDALISEMKNETLANSAIKSDAGPVMAGTIRNSKQKFLQSNHWFEGILFNHIRYANHSMNLNYDITGCEYVQYTVYKKNQQYKFHVDQDVDNPSNLMRKLTAVCLLSDPADFEGGGTVFEKKPTFNLLQKQGDIVVFPSYIRHAALEVTKGKRITAVLWAIGPAFK